MQTSDLTVTGLRALIDASMKEHNADPARADFDERKDSVISDVWKMGGESVIAAWERNRTWEMESQPSVLIPRADAFDATNIREVFAFSRDRLNPTNCRAMFDVYLSTQPRTSEEREHHQLAARIMTLTALGRVLYNNPFWKVADSECAASLLLWRKYLGLTLHLFGRDFLTRAFDTGEVSEWTPTAVSSQVIRYFEVAGAVAPNFIQYPMPAGSCNVPLFLRPTPGVDGGSLADIAPARVRGEFTGLPSGGYNYATYPTYAAGSYASTDRAALNDISMRGIVIVTEDMTEESAVPMLDFLGRLMANECRRGVEDAIINGGTVNNQPDSDLIVTAWPDGTKYSRAAWVGLRERARGKSAYSAAAGNAWTDATFLAAHKKLVVSSDASQAMLSTLTDIMVITSGFGFVNMLTNDTTKKLFLPASQLGTRANPPLGAIGTYMGFPLVLSEFVRINCNANGFYDNSTTDKTMAVLAHRRGWVLGQRGGIYIEQERIPAYASGAIMGVWKGDFKSVLPTAWNGEAILGGLSK
jgi:hypothetical protein